MKKWLVVLIAVVALGAGVTGVSARGGRAILARLSTQTKALTQLLPGMQVEESVSPGLFRSVREVKFSFGCAPVPKPDADAAANSSTPRVPLTLRWRDTIHHRPFADGKHFAAAVIDTELLPDTAAAKEVTALFGQETMLTAHTRVDSGGRYESDMRMPGATINTSAEEKVVWSGLQATVSGQVPEAAGTASYHMTVEPLRLHVQSPQINGEFAFGTIRGSVSAQYDPAALHLMVPAKSEFLAESVKMTAHPSAGSADPAVDVTLSKLSAKSDATTDKELWSTDSSFTSAMNVNGFVVDKFEAALALRRIHIPTYEKVIREIMKVAFSCEATPADKDPALMFAGMQGDLFELLSHDPEYVMGPIGVEIGGKRAELSYSMATQGVTPSDAGMPLETLLRTKSNTHAKASVDLGLVDLLVRFAQQAPAGAGGAADPQQVAAAAEQSVATVRGMVDQFVKQGYVTREGEVIRASFDSQGDQFKLNGQPFTMPDLSSLGGP